MIPKRVTPNAPGMEPALFHSMMRVTKEQMKQELEQMPTGFEDEPTVIDASEDIELASPTPPALPFTLMREKPQDDGGWIMSLSPAARAVLERATMPAPNWPIAGRLDGAVAKPIQKIPSL